MAFRVLVADDESNIRTLLIRILEASGHQVTAAADGRAALERISAEEFDLLICDQSMPHTTGEQVAAVARATKPNTKVILLSGNPDRSGRLPAGVHLILSKPISITALQEAIEQVMA